MAMEGRLGASGELSARLIKGKKKAQITTAPLNWKIRNAARPNFLTGYLANRIARTLSRVTGIPTMTAELHGVVIRADGSRIDYGLLGSRVVTTAFVNFVVDQLQAETAVFGDFKYHDAGVGSTAENVADTGIETTDGEARATGTQTEDAANQYVSVGTISYTTTKAVTEHGLFNDPTAGTLMDRTVFAAINVVNGDSIEFTYTLTLTAGS